MIKLVYCIRKRAELSSEAFRKYWLETHGPLVRELAATLRATKYVQSHTIEPAVNDAIAKTRGMSRPYDGITELWWNSSEAFQSIFADTPALQMMHQRLIEDEARFIDLTASCAFVTEEHPIF